jgi:ribA/ribD-fused uncharacterized protein
MSITRFNGEYDFLSNFYLCPILFEGITFPSTEHAFQAAKTLNLDDRKRIANLSTPGKAKREGRKLKLQPNWDKIKVGIMDFILRVKFQKGTVLAQKLIDTGNEDLIEGNDWADTFWGKCGGVGHNMLGELLVKIRCDLQTI